MFPTKFQISNVSYLASSVKVIHPEITDEELKNAIASAQTALDDTLDKYDIAISRQACLTGVTLIFDVVIPAIISTLPTYVQTVLKLVLPLLKQACTAYCNSLPSATVQAQNGFLQGPLATTYLSHAVSGSTAPANHVQAGQAATGTLFLCTVLSVCGSVAPAVAPANHVQAGQAATGTLVLCTGIPFVCGSAAPAVAPANHVQAGQAATGTLVLCTGIPFVCGSAAHATAPQVDTILPPKTFFVCD